MALLGRLFSSSSSPSLSFRGSKRSLGGNDIEDLRLCPNISSDADSLASEMNAHAARLLSAAISLEYCASRISYRYSITHRMFLLAFADIRDALVAAQSIFRWSCLQLLSARSKSLDDQSDEMDVNAKVLAMYSRVCDGLSVVDSMGSASSVSAISSFLASLDARMLVRESAIFATACINMDVTAAALHHCFWMQEGHDPTATVVSGSGALWCRAGDDTHNRIRVEVKDERGDAIVGLDTSDFVVEVRVGDVPPVPPSLETMIGTAFEFVYNIEKSGSCGSKTATIDVLLFGQLIVSKSVSVCCRVSWSASVVFSVLKSHISFCSSDRRKHRW